MPIRIRSILLLITFILASSGQGLAAPAASQAAGKVIWDYWYTVTINKTVRYEYYHDRLEEKGGRYIIQNQAWKQEEDYINEEQLGVFAAANADLTPLFYNFHSSYRTTETKIDGTVQDGKTLTVRIRKGNVDLPIVKKGIQSKVIFSTFFPFWMGKRLASAREGQVVPFIAILEDNLELGFNTVHGSFRLEKPDPYATHTKTRRVTVDFQGLHTVWWVDQQGAPMRIDDPKQKSVVERVPEAKAKAFLD